MESLIYLATPDINFAETLCRMVADWGFAVQHDILPEKTTMAHHQEQIAVILLDVRLDEHSALKLLQTIKAERPEVEAILINRPENIRVSMSGMQAGAGDEIIVPFDTAELKNKIQAGCKRYEKRRRKKGHRSLLDRFSDSMAAATFAQAGEFNTAADFLDRPEADGHPRKKVD